MTDVTAYIPKGWKAFLNSLNFYGFWQRVANVLQLLVSGTIWNKNTMPICWVVKNAKFDHFSWNDNSPTHLTNSQATNDSTPSNWGMDNWNGVSQLWFKNTAKHIELRLIFKVCTPMLEYDVKTLPVKVFGSANSHQAVRICELSKNTNFIVVLKLKSNRHVIKTAITIARKEDNGKRR